MKKILIMLAILAVVRAVSAAETPPPPVPAPLTAVTTSVPPTASTVVTPAVTPADAVPPVPPAPTPPAMVPAPTSVAAVVETTVTNLSAGGVVPTGEPVALPGPESSDAVDAPAAPSTNTAPEIQPPSGNPDFERYRIIVDRKPFGAGAPLVNSNAINAAALAAANMGFTRNLRVSGWWKMDDGETKVAFVDNATKKGFLLALGQAGDDGTRLDTADFDAGTFTLTRGAETGTVTLDLSAPTGAPAAGGSSRGHSHGSPPGMPGMPGVTAATSGSSPSGPPPMPSSIASVNPAAAAARSLSYAERRRLRQEQIAPAVAAPTAPGAAVAPVPGGAPALAPAVPGTAPVAATTVSLPVNPSTVMPPALAQQAAVVPNPNAVAVPTPSPEEQQKALQEYQMEVIRKGLPPLPIPLTPEMDQQLVTEGVLPPQPPQ
jgi:hypothetical protein